METDGLQSQLKNIAREYANEQNWPWREPTEVNMENAAEHIWSVRTNVFAVGMNILILIRASDFQVIEVSFLPR